MTETLTESFCERCGTRYTFETARPRTSRLRRARTLTKGLRNYILSQDSLAEAMADARGEEELSATVLQLDAFHHAFNFCIDCRQYTCGNCWNDAAGRCLSCVPLPASAPEGDLAPHELTAPADRPASPDAPHPEPPPPGARDEALAWPKADLRVVPAVVASGPTVETTAPEPRALGVTRPDILGLEPGQRLDEAIAAYEATRTAGAPATLPPELQPVVEAPAEVAAPTPVAEAVLPLSALAPAELADQAALPDEVAAEQAALPAEVAAEAEEPPAEPMAAAGEPAADAIEEVAPPAEPAAAADPAPPAAQTAPAEQTEAVRDAAPRPAIGAGWLTVAPDDARPPATTQDPVWPATGRPPMVGMLAGRRLASPSDPAALWAASAREVLSGGPRPGGAGQSRPSGPATPQPCVSCGLPLSVNARFCRRCGSRQG